MFNALCHFYAADEFSPKRSKVSGVGPSVVQEKLSADISITAPAAPPPRVESIDPQTVVMEITDVSFQSPLRKKMSLVFAVNPVSQLPYLAVAKPGEAPELVLGDLGPLNITFAGLLPTSRDKPHFQTMLIFYRHNQDDRFNAEPVILTLNEEVVKKQLAAKLGSAYTLNSFLEKQAEMFGLALCSPFQTPGSKSFFVDAYKGSKEGTLYFLPHHILFGYKKPVLLFQSVDIEAITYTSITRLTFNLNLAFASGEKLEFSMIDQDEFNKIDDYIKHREVADKSMSTVLKGKATTKRELREPGALADMVGLEVAADGAEDEDEDDESFHSGMESDSVSEGLSDSEDDSPRKVFTRMEEEEDLGDDHSDEMEEDHDEEDHSDDLGNDP